MAYRRLHIVKWAWLFAGLFCFVSCSKETVQPTDVSMRTVLVYLGGDNNLRTEVYDRIEKLRENWKNYNGRLLIYADARNDVPQLMEIYRDAKDENLVRIIAKYPQENSASSDVFGRVLRDMVDHFPARSYGLMLFSHASGWLPAGELENNITRSVINDNGDEMEVSDFAAAIPDRLFSFILFEACYMASAEVAYELRNKTDYILASSAEMVSPGLQPVYGKLLKSIYQEEPDLKGVARSYFDYYNALSGNKQSATVSVIRTSELPALARRIAQAGVSYADPAQVQNFTRPAKASLFFDLDDYYKQGVLPEHYEAIAEQLARCVVYQAATRQFALLLNGFQIRTHCGLTVYIPQERYETLNDAYRQLGWYRAIGGE